jgi:hypothetical protein
VVAQGDASTKTLIPLLEGRVMVDEKPTAYLCFDFRCDAPITAPEELAVRLGGL